jgi:hypothetical protein
MVLAGWLSEFHAKQSYLGRLMFSIEFAIGFVILGLILSLLLGEVISILLIIGVTIGWAFSYDLRNFSQINR